MKFLCLMIILFAFFAPIKSYATQQKPDNIIYKGNLYKLEQNSLLSPYLGKDKNKWEWLWKSGTSTNLWRGYFATFEVVDNKLVLKEIENSSKKSILEKFLSVAGTKGSFKLDYYSDTLILSGGKLLYSGRAFKIHEYHLFLEFKNGILIKESRMNYIEYLAYEKDRLTRLEKLFGDNEYLDALEKLEYYKAMENGELPAELKTKYKKKFGEQISDFELATEEVFFRSIISFPIYYDIIVTKTAKGARARYRYYYHYASDDVEVELSAEEWLDFIRAIYKCRTDKWEKRYGKWTEDAKGWELNVYSFGKDKPNDFSGHNAYPPNWGEFKKIIDDMETRIRKDSATKALETKLAAEHKKIYGTSISDFELSAKHVEFETLELGRGMTITVTRTATGALAKYHLGGAYVKKDENKNLAVELNIKEWLSFIKAIYKCRVNEWKEYYSSTLPNETDFSWQTEIFFTDRDGFLFRGSLAYPLNWNEFQKILDGIKGKLR